MNTNTPKKRKTVGQLGLERLEELEVQRYRDSLPKHWRTHSTGLASSVRSINQLLCALELVPPVIPKERPPVINPPPIIRTKKR